MPTTPPRPPTLKPKPARRRFDPRPGTVSPLCPPRPPTPRWPREGRVWRPPRSRPPPGRALLRTRRLRPPRPTTLPDSCRPTSPTPPRPRPRTPPFGWCLGSSPTRGPARGERGGAGLRWGRRGRGRGARGGGRRNLQQQRRWGRRGREERRHHRLGRRLRGNRGRWGARGRGAATPPLGSTQSTFRTRRRPLRRRPQSAGPSPPPTAPWPQSRRSPPPYASSLRAEGSMAYPRASPRPPPLPPSAVPPPSPPPPWKPTASHEGPKPRMSRHDTTWHNTAWHNRTRHDTTRHDTTRHDMKERERERERAVAQGRVGECCGPLCPVSGPPRLPRSRYYPVIVPAAPPHLSSPPYLRRPGPQECPRESR